SCVNLEKYLNYSCNWQKEKQNMGLTASSRVIGTIARLVPIKGLEYLIKAFTITVGEFSDARLLILGDGPQEAKLRRLADELGVTQKVMFLEPTEDIRPILSSFEVYVQPSLNEGLGMAIIEAMALAKPVIASRVGGVVDLLSDECGILVEAGNAHTLAQAIKKLLLDKELAKTLGAKAKASVWPKYDVKTEIQDIEKVYARLIEEKL
ncbi:MAG: glycosyltransferase family 4 protein, partial [Candidatus Omnitrophota bacterium]